MASAIAGFPPPIYKNPTSTNGALLKFNGVTGNKVQEIVPGANGDILTVVGGAWVSTPAAISTNAPAGTGFVKVNSGVFTTTASISLTADVGASILPLANGGTNKNFTASTGAIIYSDADSFEMLSCASGQYIKSNGTSAPSCDTPTGGSGVTGPASTSTGAIVLWNSTTGAAIKQLAFGTDGQVPTVSNGAIIMATVTGAPRVAYVKDVKSAGTDGGGYTSGSATVRDLNTVSGDTFLTVSSNKFTISETGNYDFDGSSPMQAVNGFSCRVNRDPDGGNAALINGTDSYSDSTAGTNANVNARSFITGRVTISTIDGANNKFSVSCQAGATKATFGLGSGSSFNSNSTYTVLKITKVN